MEYILRDKNENVSSGQLVLQSKSDTESSTTTENLKENFNPKSLIEIAADTSSKFQLDASTPKNPKRSGSFKDTSFNINIINDSFSHQENIPTTNDSLGLSFLANGLNNLKLKSAEASDDEEQFLSFHDMSNRVEDQTKSMENLNVKNDETLVLEEKNELDVKNTEDNASVENIQTDMKAENAVIHDEKVDTEQLVAVEKEENVEIVKEEGTVQNDNNEIIQAEENAEFYDAEISQEVPNSSSTNVINDSHNNVSGNVTQILNDNKENLSELNESTGSKKSETVPDANQTYEKINKTIDEIELKETAKIVGMNATFDGAQIIDQNSSYSLQTTLPVETNSLHTTLPLDDIKQCTFQVQNSSVEHMEIDEIENPQLTQTIEEKHLNSTFDKSQSFDTKPVESSTFSNIDDIKIRMESIDESDISSDLNCSKPVQQNQTVTLNSTFDGVKNTEKNFMESLQPNLDVEFKMPTLPLSRKSSEKTQDVQKEEFTCGSSYNFGYSDFDFLQNFGSNSSDQNFGRDSVLLKFDPLLAKPVPQVSSSNFEKLTEEDEHTSEITPKEIEIDSQEDTKEDTRNTENSFSSLVDEFPQLIPLDSKQDMNVEIMKDIVSENEKQISNLECEEIKLSSIDHHENQNNKLMELESKMRMEAEQREEVLLKRISEKDKQISKMSNVVKEYEKAIAELIAEKEQLVQSYEKKCVDLKNDSELNAQHLASLESTFSDLHAKYERTKQLASDLKEREESTLQDRKALMDNLKMQEARYEKMKTHAMAQLEIANNKLAEMLRNHQAEVTKLKAQLKKEEISRASINEQLIQKSKENAELVKICDELIGNHGNSHAV